MSVYLIKTTEQYRCNTEGEAKNLIEEAKKSHSYNLSKYSSEERNVKKNGEIVDSWFRVVLTKAFDDEKEPFGSIREVHYGTTEGGQGFED